MNICVYLGANKGNQPIYGEAVMELGRWIAANGHRLIYGGSKTGLMGLLAQQVLAGGGEVIGIEPAFFIEKEFQLEGITELIVTDDMTERKAKMIELSDFFIAFPGGIGTAEEIAEVICMGGLGMTDKPYGYYNINGYYNHMIAHYDHMCEEGFLSEWARERIHFFESLDDIAAVVAENV